MAGHPHDALRVPLQRRSGRLGSPLHDSRCCSPQRTDGVDDDGRRPRAVCGRQHLLAVGPRPISRQRAVSVAGRCLAGSAYVPSFYVGVVLLVRERMPHLDSRLWLDGIVAALTTGAVSAALVFGALQVSTGGDPAAVATNLAYPLGDMILLASVIGAMAAGRSRLDRSWLWFGAGIAAFAVADSIYLLQIAKDTYVGDTLLDIGWLVAGLLVGIAAWQPPCASAPPATSCRASSRRPCSPWPASRCSSTTTSRRINLLAVALSRRRARGGAHPPVAHAPREPLEPGHDARRRRARTRSPGSATASPCSARWSTRWATRRRTCCCSSTSTASRTTTTPTGTRPATRC